ncbi:MAG: [FeFe] hydrogenase H-cluster maturation GTPase HydF [Eubacterium sp.]|nr:[FeFe] hydrogenase H-cluster maturation GTPase HydF [Eubacterium sp.]
MSLNDTPSSERTHIAFFGCRNAGKSSLVNAITGQDMSVVSDVRGTTTDPVTKSMELLPMGPVVIIDTPGFDDEGQLGELRVVKTKQVLNRSDVAVLVVDITQGLGAWENRLIDMFKEKEIPYIVVYNKSDLTDGAVCPGDDENSIAVSAEQGTGINELKEKIAHISAHNKVEIPLVSDLISPEDLIVLVIPIDSAAPKGRIILPQQQVLRDILDTGAMAVCAREFELPGLLKKLSGDAKPSLVITDSQAFAQVSRDVSEDIPLTSFSILMARYKGLLDEAVRGVTAIENLRDGDTVLISEGCTHHRQCDDIGTYKIPKWLKEYTGKDIKIETSSGRGFPDDLSPYSMIIHCGGCMLNQREILYRMKCAGDQNVPITNYGIAIAYLKGILKRSLSVFPHLSELV